jgi:hypothetical protein
VIAARVPTSGAVAVVGALVVMDIDQVVPTLVTLLSS